MQILYFLPQNIKSANISFWIPYIWTQNQILFDQCFYNKIFIIGQWSFLKQTKSLSLIIQLLNLSLNTNYLKEYNYTLFQHVSTRSPENFIDKIFFFIEKCKSTEQRKIRPSFVLELIFDEGSKNDASQINTNQKIRKYQKIFEKVFNKINQNEKKIEND
ncbi:unnamed protein product [Paramecium pentaurelia]|uniref:Uncharacterized protein n=1 Tax=Paramecium pentaurelia TaxID=43138 RepID=A0A8S1XV06_9CILI|nr:unnamed protein product [Paramecium pentaurelia]